MSCLSFILGDKNSRKSKHALISNLTFQGVPARMNNKKMDTLSSLQRKYEVNFSARSHLKSGRTSPTYIFATKGEAGPWPQSGFPALIAAWYVGKCLHIRFALMVLLKNDLAVWERIFPVSKI